MKGTKFVPSYCAGFGMSLRQWRNEMKDAGILVISHEWISSVRSMRWRVFPVAIQIPKKFFARHRCALSLYTYGPIWRTVCHAVTARACNFLRTKRVIDPDVTLCRRSCHAAEREQRICVRQIVDRRPTVQRRHSHSPAQLRHASLRTAVAKPQAAHARLPNAMAAGSGTGVKLALRSSIPMHISARCCLPSQR